MEDNCNPVGVDVAMVSISKLYWINPIIDFLAKDKVPNDEKRLKRFVEWLPSISCRQIANYTGGFSEAHTFYAYISRK